MKEKLWTRDFTIITAGTFVSMLGNSMAAITVSMLVLDNTGSTFLFALFLVLNNLPKIIIPLFAGPLLDRTSRKKMVCMLDYISGGLYYVMFIMLSVNQINYIFLLLATTLFGVVDSVYNVAYESLYPNLVSKANYTKAYSVASMLFPLAMMATPLGAFLYEKVGIAPILFVNAATFFIAAFAESLVKIQERHTKSVQKNYSPKTYARDFREGIRYIADNKGLLMITVYFCLNMFCDSTQNTLVLPYFKNTEGLSELMFTFITISGVAGRLLGGAYHYKYKYPSSAKFFLACFVYVATCLMDGAMLFVPLIVMFIFQFLSGIMGVTSYNIRVSAIQSSIPDGFRARLNGIFAMIYSLGTIAGQLVSGALAEIVPIRAVVVLFSSLNIVFVFAIFTKNAKHIKPIYNIKI